MVDWKKLKKGDFLRYHYDDFDGKGEFLCVVTLVDSEYVIAASTSEETFFIDDDTAYLFSKEEKEII